MAAIDEDKVNRPVLAEDDGLADETLEECGEGGLGHLARGDREFPMAHLTPAHRMPMDRHIVWRVADPHLGQLAPPQQLVGRALQGVAAHPPAPAPLPPNAPSADGR